MSIFDHTLQNCNNAKAQLIEMGYNDPEDFYEAGEDYIEIGFLVGEPMLITNDDDCYSALDAFKDILLGEENADNMVDFYIENDTL
jgi:hypothetical protein